jgi:nicotinamide riboside kinase
MGKKLIQYQQSGITKIVKIALFGPESTGKTTLAKQLAEYYKTEWVPEFARDYLQEKWDINQGVCDIDDMLPIAYGQTKLENEFLSTANGYLFCDTNLMVTKVFSEVYYNYCNPLLNQAALEHEYDLFFLTDIDLPWEKDDLRDDSKERKLMFNAFKQSLIENKKPFITLSGDKISRLNKAISIIDNLTEAKKIGFSSIDFVQIYENEVSLENIKLQLNFFRNGIVKSNLVRPATLLDGILKLSESDFQEKAVFFDENKSNFKLEKFVPASGAATRMFKFLITFMKDYDIENDTINGYINKNKDLELSIFIVGLEKFPFFKAIDKKLREEFPNFESLDRDYKNYYFIQLLLAKNHFDFSSKPKGALPFHKNQKKIVTPVEEHLDECIFYANSNNSSNLHFTVSETHFGQFESIIDKLKDSLETKSKTAINVNYSCQNKKTDTIAVDFENNPFRDENGRLFFRPGGHGALIENLNLLDSDIVFIKNIDNVIQNNVEKTGIYKKALAGILIELQQQIFKYLQAFDDGEIQEENMDEILLFLKEKLNIRISDEFRKFTFENKVIEIQSVLNKPIRVCGMVKNEGEAGGGPFWVKDYEGGISLQIVESSQVDRLNENQNKILNASTHFNPVDLVCGIKNHKNEKYDLIQFVDHNSGFIVEKTAFGRDVKSYELPGLWNGAMKNWITIFVQVPLITFNPVKSVNDLLKTAHQPEKIEKRKNNNRIRS